MPELPEVETVRTKLAPELEGRRFERVAISDARLTRPDDPDEVAHALEGERVARVERRGKYLLLRFESGRVLLVHLRMTGSLGLEPAGVLDDDPYRRAVVTLDDGTQLTYRDVRRFGTWQLLDADDAADHLDERLGPEPLGLRTATLAARLARRRAPIKSAILDQRTVAGVGNIYADEALWWARVHPLRPAESLDAGEVKALRAGIKRALERGLARHGSTLRDYRLPDGSSGGMQRAFKVYGRGGLPCERCGTPIERITVGGRGTWFCPSCQRSPYAASASSASRRPSRSRARSSL
jgi:formamidopyrimidine-DNA glycosylase